jgi:hypothetical protein
MNIQVEPSTIYDTWWPIEEHHFTHVPPLVWLTDVGQVEGSETIGGIWWHSGHTAHIPLTTMCRVTVVPYVDWDLQTLHRSSPGWTHIAQPIPGWDKSNTSHKTQTLPPLRVYIKSPLTFKTNASLILSVSDTRAQTHNIKCKLPDFMLGEQDIKNWLV